MNIKNKSMNKPKDYLLRLINYKEENNSPLKRGKRYKVLSIKNPFSF